MSYPLHSCPKRASVAFLLGGSPASCFPRQQILRAFYLPLRRPGTAWVVPNERLSEGRKKERKNRRRVEERKSDLAGLIRVSFYLTQTILLSEVCQFTRIAFRGSPRRRRRSSCCFSSFFLFSFPLETAGLHTHGSRFPLSHGHALSTTGASNR